MNNEEGGIAQRFVELSGMARKHIHTLEDERPGHVGGPSDYLRVHQVAEADGAGTNGCDDGHVVQDVHERQLHLAGIQPDGYHQTKCSAVTGKPFVAGKRPSLSRHVAYGQQHLNGMRKVIAWFVEQTMPQPGSNQYAEEAIHEHRLELLVAYLLLTE